MAEERKLPPPSYIEEIKTECISTEELGFVKKGNLISAASFIAPADKSPVIMSPSFKVFLMTTNDRY